MNDRVATLSDLLEPYRPSAIAEAVGVTADTVRLWRAKKSTPATDKLALLAAFLRIETSDVVAAIANQRKSVMV